MNPNSVHQWWSRWTATVTPDPARPVPPIVLVTDNCARFYRKAFGSATALRVAATATGWVIECRTEGHPAHDPAYVAWMTQQLRRFLRNGFGAQAQVTFAVTLEAGDRQDGTPPDQLILGPAPVVLDPHVFRS